MAAPAELLDSLRAAIRERESSPVRTGWGACPTGFAPFDALLPGGGFPLGRVVELTGTAASGKLTLALGAMARATREEKLVAFVDPGREFYPPAAASLGVDLKRLLIVRPRKPEEGLRAAGLIARSGAFSLVALDLATPPRHLGPVSSRLFEAAQAGRSTLLLLTPLPSGLDTTLRLAITRADDGALVFSVERSRLGPPGKRGRLAIDDPTPLLLLRP